MAGDSVRATLDDVKGMPLALLRRYLLARHWRASLDRTGTAELFVLHESDAPDVELVLPREVQSPDQLRRIQFAVSTLAELRDTSAQAVVADVMAIDVDIIRSVIPDEAVVNSSIHLKAATDFVLRAKRLLAASATTELYPDRFFGRVRKEAQLYADQCRFGHTFKGSFGFVIESYVGPNIEPPLDGFEARPAPFARRVIERISRGMTTIRQAHAAEDPQAISNAFQTGLSANMCDELIDIFQATESDKLTLEVSLSPEWPASTDVPATQSLRITPRHVEVMEQASKLLRQQEVDRNRELHGRIEQLKSQTDPTGTEGQREITLRTEMPDFNEIRVRIVLPPADYLHAVEAHKAGQAITITGTLSRVGRQWVLLDPQALRIGQ